MHNVAKPNAAPGDSEENTKKTKLSKDRLKWISELKRTNNVYQAKRNSYWVDKITNDSDNPKKLWKSFNTVLGRAGESSLSTAGLASEEFLNFFSSKTDDVARSTASAPYPVLTDTASNSFTSFDVISVNDVINLITAVPNKQCALDPAPTWLIKEFIELLAPFFAYVCNRSLGEGYVPTSQKAALVFPVLKKETLDKHELKNYRPISNLTFLSKLIERVVSKQLTDYLERNRLLPKFQSAYRRCHPTETALLKVYSDLTDAIDRGEVTLLGLLDLSSAFDTVDHNVLLDRLKLTHGISDIALKWIKSYLCDRQQTIVVNDVHSSTQTLVRGVPQGSVLGPMLFTLYTTEIQEIILSYNLECHIYADDTQLYFHCAPSQLATVTPRLVECIQSIREWMSSNRLRLNPDKTEFIWFSSARNMQHVPQASITVGGSTITPSRTVRDLGVYLDTTLGLTDHVTRTVQSSFFQLRQLKYVRRCLNKDNTKILLHAFVTSRLDYCNALLAGQPACLIDKLQSVQNAAARLYAGVSRYDHITSVLRDDLHWLRVPQRITYKLCTFVFRCLHGDAPSYLSEYCIPLAEANSRASRNRSAAQGNLVVPRSRTLTYGQRSFRVAGPSSWNELPPHLKSDQLSYPCFKSQLKTHLFTLCYL